MALMQLNTLTANALSEEFLIKPCSASLFQLVKKYISELQLDDRHLQHSEFLVALCNNKLVGFGRIREFETCSELCSLGVIVSERLHGVAKQLTEALIKKARRPVFLVSVIPSFFKSLGFCPQASYPIEITEKLSYCENTLSVDTRYVAMKLCSGKMAIARI